MQSNIRKSADRLQGMLPHDSLYHVENLAWNDRLTDDGVKEDETIPLESLLEICAQTVLFTLKADLSLGKSLLGLLLEAGLTPSEEVVGKKLASVFSNIIIKNGLSIYGAPQMLFLSKMENGIWLLGGSQQKLTIGKKFPMGWKDKLEKATQKTRKELFKTLPCARELTNIWTEALSRLEQQNAVTKGTNNRFRFRSESHLWDQLRSRGIDYLTQQEEEEANSPYGQAFSLQPPHVWETRGPCGKCRYLHRDFSYTKVAHPDLSIYPVLSCAEDSWIVKYKLLQPGWTDRKGGNDDCSRGEQLHYRDKIKKLANISPARQRVTSPEVRGMVIAMEGTDLALVAKAGRFLERHLAEQTGLLVRVWDADSLLRKEGQNDSKFCEEEAAGGKSSLYPHAIDMGGVLLDGASSTCDSACTFEEYLSEVKGWHEKSRDITEFVTSISAPFAPLLVDGKFSAQCTAVSIAETASNETTRPKIISNLPTSTELLNADAHQGIATSNRNFRVPIALLPTGYSLSVSDKFAERIPKDSLNANDHWMWVAQLWRGIIGPDLTIYVESVNEGSPMQQKDGNGREEVKQSAAAGNVKTVFDHKPALVCVKMQGKGDGLAVEDIEKTELTLTELGAAVLLFIKRHSATVH